MSAVFDICQISIYVYICHRHKWPDEERLGDNSLISESPIGELISALVTPYYQILYMVLYMYMYIIYTLYHIFILSQLNANAALILYLNSLINQ